MSTTVSISIYVCYILWRVWKDRVTDERAAMIEADRKRTELELKKRILALEEAIESSPFIKFHLELQQQ